jgi:D-arabinose 1-dehydrogenase-like Zn-dependent alcohol dehydrogenase
MRAVGFRRRDFRHDIQAVSDPVPKESDVVVKIGRCGISEGINAS